MTMTPTEYRALVMELRAAITPRGKITRPLFFILRDAADYIEATEARHAAEMQELKERFSEAVCSWRDALTPVQAAKAAERLHDFIIPAPDPLVEVLNATGWAHDVKQTGMAAQLRAAIEARGGRIVWGEAALRAQEKDTNA